MVSKLTARELADRIDGNESFTLVDTRPEESYDAWHIRGAENIPFEPNESMTDEQLDHVLEVTTSDSVVAICGKGLSSTSFGLELDERQNGHGLDVSVVEGGMEAWSTVYESVPIETGHRDLRLLQIQRRAKGCLGYIVGSNSTGRAIAVDVARQTDVFKIAAQEAGLTIGRVIDTHVHADHISGGRDLARELGVPYSLSGHLSDRDVDIEYDFEPLKNGGVMTVGTVEIEAIHTPGHTSEMLALVIDDAAVLTSDTLFIDGVGRTELQFGDEEAERGASLLYESVNERLGELDDPMVLPGHVTVTPDGTFGTAAPGEPITDSLDGLRNRLDVFTLEREEFVESVTSGESEKPPNYESVIAINTGERNVDREEEATELELGPNNCSA